MYEVLRQGCPKTIFATKFFFVDFWTSFDSKDTIVFDLSGHWTLPCFELFIDGLTFTTYLSCGDVQLKLATLDQNICGL